MDSIRKLRAVGPSAARAARALVIIPFVALGTSAAADPPPCTTTLPAGADLNQAIGAADPGDVLCLSPGLYEPASTVLVNIPLTLRGPQAGVDPLSVMLHGDVALEGFEIALAAVFGS